MRAIVMDLDGTLCDGAPYLHYGDHAYHEAATTVADASHAMLEVCRRAVERGVALLVFSGRSELWQPASVTWMAGFGVIPDLIRFRDRGDWRHNPDVKRDFVREAQALGYVIEAAYDDDPRNCQMFVAEGIPYVEQVGSWDPRLS